MDLVYLCFGGAEILIVDAAMELSSHGHNVHIFTSHHDPARCFEETLSGTFPVTVYGAFRPCHIFYRLHAVCAYLRCIFVSLCMLFMWSSFEVIVADQVSVVVPLMKLKKSSKVVFYCHFPDLLLAKHTTLLRKIYRKPIDYLEEMTFLSLCSCIISSQRLFCTADLILVNSKFTASTFANTFRHLDARGIKPAVLYPAVNVDQFEEPHTFKLNFLSINRFEKKKNIKLAISAFAMLRTLEGDGLHIAASLTMQERISVLQSLIGARKYLPRCGFDKRLRENVKYLDELKELAEREGVSRQVQFVTSCSTAERNVLLSECLCPLDTPKDEHFGIVPLEAMAAHKAVIACNSGGPVDSIKNGETGFLCDPNPQDFSLAMAKFIKDTEMAKRMGEAARNHVINSFSTKIFGQQLNSVLASIARGKKD